MKTITQDMRYKQAVIAYSMKHGVTKAAIRYKTSRQNIYCWCKKYDGDIHSLADRFHRPHNHPNQHTEDEITLFKNMRRRNPHDGLVVFRVKCASVATPDPSLACTSCCAELATIP